MRRGFQALLRATLMLTLAGLLVTGCGRIDLLHGGATAGTNGSPATTGAAGTGPPGSAGDGAAGAIQTAIDQLTDDDRCGKDKRRCGPTSTCISGACGP